MGVPPLVTTLRLSSLLAANLGAGALFGFFYTMNVSIMPGMDLAPPYAAITANQDIGRATKQSGFIIALLGTPLSTIASIALHRRSPFVRNWLCLGLAGWCGMLAVTLSLNVPLNQILDNLVITPDTDPKVLRDHWLAYSVDWQKYNWLRVLTSGISLVGMCMAMRASSPATARQLGAEMAKRKVG